MTMAVASLSINFDLSSFAASSKMDCMIFAVLVRGTKKSCDACVADEVRDRACSTRTSPSASLVLGLGGVGRTEGGGGIAMEWTCEHNKERDFGEAITQSK